MSDSNTVILGSGIVGLSTAYYLSQSGKTPPHSIHLVDSTSQLFHCASGFAGGFLAADWYAPSVAALGALSFKLHKELADQHNGRKTWGYSPSTGMSLSQDSESAVGGSGEDWLRNGTSRAEATTSRASVDAKGPVWLKTVEESSLEVISQEGLAQIDPLRFCQWLLARCLERGVQLHQPARALSVSKDDHNRLNGIRISEEGAETDLPCTRLVLTSGAWSPRIFSTLFPKSTTRIPISALAGHSLLVRNPFFQGEELDTEACHAVFATDTLGFSPEWFSRVGGELYLAGLNTTQIPLPDLATDVQANPKAIEQLKACTSEMMRAAEGKQMEVLREGLCFRPITSSGRPLVSRIPDHRLGAGFTTRGGSDGGVFVAGGHGAWGISQAPGTGLVLSELIEGRKTTADITALALP